MSNVLENSRRMLKGCLGIMDATRIPSHLLNDVKPSVVRSLEMPSLPMATITPARRLQGRIRVPGDKSISHRYALLAAVSEGRSELRNYAPGADCRSTLSCLSRLGIEVVTTGDVVTLLGRKLRSLRSPGGPLDAGNSGTTMRMLAGVLAGQTFESEM